MEVVYVIVGILVVLIAKIIYDRKKNKKARLEFIRKSYGKEPEKKRTEEKLESIPFYSNRHLNSKQHVDDITWNDLDMDSVYEVIDSTCCAPGEEYLYAILRNPVADEKILLERERLIKLFSENIELRELLQLRLLEVGSVARISVYEYINRLNDIPREKNLRHILQAILLFAAIGVIAINPVYGIIATVIIFFYNVTTYFKRKSEIENYFSVTALLVRLLDSAQKISEIPNAELDEYKERLRKDISAFNGFRSGAALVVPAGFSTDIVQSLLDYLRMGLHIDLIKFNKMLDTFFNKEEQFNDLFEVIGLLDSAIAIGSFRKLYPQHTAPVFVSEKQITADDLYHPLIEEPVKNSVKVNNSWLLTGSNASGKSTFLKTVAINQILAQSIHTVLADSYSCCFFNIMSSMALTDNLLNGESYYIVEIRSLKRIMDAVCDDIPVLMFIDEVLRGTNTVERISASSVILKSLASANSLCFAATHDIELTYILENYYDNYHFEETVDGDIVSFDYRLKEGRSVTRNAIKLLSMLGYNDTIISSATEMANEYLKTGEWKKYV